MDKGKDARKPGWFWADNKVVDVHAADIGINAFGVYMVLVRHLNGDEECWPSSATIGKLLGISQRSVIRAIKILEAKHLIEITAREKEGKGQISNLYTVHRVGAPNEETADTPMTESHRGVTDSHRAYDTESEAPMTESHTNNTNVNKTQRKSGGVANASQTTPPPLDPIRVGLIKAGLTPDQATIALPLQTFTPEIITALHVWAKGLKARGVNPGKVLHGYTKIGMLPDDLILPEPDEPQGPAVEWFYDEASNTMRPSDPVAWARIKAQENGRPQQRIPH